MAWPPGLWSRGSACLAVMPSVCGVEGSRAPGPQSWPPLPTARRSAAGPASPVSEGGLAELPGEGLTSSGLHLVRRGPLATLPVDPTYLWTPEGPGCLEPRVGRVSFLGHFSFHLVSTYLRAFTSIFVFISLRFLNCAIPTPPPLLFIIFTFSSDLYICLCYTQVR